MKSLANLIWQLKHIIYILQIILHKSTQKGSNIKKTVFVILPQICHEIIKVQRMKI